MSDTTGTKEEKLLFCSFCGKNQNEVRKLIAGPSVYICNECIDLCNDIIQEEINESMQGIRSSDSDNNSLFSDNNSSEDHDEGTE